MVYIVGIGPGHRDYILPKATDTLKSSDVILGFGRALSSIDFLDKPKIKLSGIKEILNYIIEHKEENIAIVASGDPNFYGISEYIRRNFQGNIEIIPGITSFQYLCGKLNKSWQNAYLGSLHGREDEFVGKVKNNKISIWLTDKKNYPGNICKKIFQNHINAKVYIGENLSYEDEKITIDYVENIKDKDFSELCIIIIENLDL